MGVLEDGIRNLERAGVVDVFLPFILIFAIVFGILSKLEIFGDNSKKFNVLISLVVGLVPVFQHVLYPNSKYDVIPIINAAIPQVAIALIAIVMLILLLGFFGGPKPFGKDSASGIMVIVGIIAIVYIFGSSAGFGWYQLPYWLQLNPETVSIIVALVVFGLVIAYITSDSKKSGDKKDGIVSLFGDRFSEK